MSSTDLSVELAKAVEKPKPLPLTATVYTDWAAAEPRWDRLTATGNALPFQRTAWLRTWYRHFQGPDTEPVIVLLRSAAGGADALGLALVRQRQGGKRVVTFADGGLTDYNAPAIGAGFDDGQNARALWSVFKRALPAADLLRFEKMPLMIDGRPNPLAHLSGVQPSSLNGNVLHVPGSWESWRGGLKRHFRKELGRVGRIFDSHEGASFRRFAAGAEAERAYAQLELLQKARIAELGHPYILDQEPARGFYRDIMQQGLRDGTAILTALSIGDEIVAALLGITDGTHYAMTRLATPGPQWKQFSPGLVLIERSLKMLHAEGYRDFDFTIGDYTYKRRLGTTTYPLAEVTSALSPMGWPAAASARVKGELRQRPGLMAAVRRLRGAAAEPAAPSVDPAAGAL